MYLSRNLAFRSEQHYIRQQGIALQTAPQVVPDIWKRYLSTTAGVLRVYICP